MSLKFEYTKSLGVKFTVQQSDDEAIKEAAGSVLQGLWSQDAFIKMVQDEYRRQCPNLTEREANCLVTALVEDETLDDLEVGLTIVFNGREIMCGVEIILDGVVLSSGTLTKPHEGIPVILEDWIDLVSTKLVPVP